MFSHKLKRCNRTGLFWMKPSKFVTAHTHWWWEILAVIRVRGGKLQISWMLSHTQIIVCATNQHKIPPGGQMESLSGNRPGLSPFLTGRMFVCPNILRTLRRTMICFLIELLVRWIWFGQSKLYFILNWLVMRCKLRPRHAADVQQTAWS